MLVGILHQTVQLKYQVKPVNRWFYLFSPGREWFWYAMTNWDI